MKNFNSRNAELKIKFNNHLQKLTKTETDFYDALANEDILELKTVLSDINNLLTYRLTLISGKWIGNYFKFSEDEKNDLINKLDSIQPNAQGFDIVIEAPIKLIAEVKCNVPVKGGSKFGSAQSQSLLKDVQKLLNGKRQIPNTSEYLKFLFIINIGNRSEDAMLNLVRKTKLRVENEERAKRNLAREKMIILGNEKHTNLEYGNVYLKMLDLNNEN